MNLASRRISQRFLWFWLLLLFHLTRDFSSIDFRLTFPWAITRFTLLGSYPFCTFTPTHCRVICNTLIIVVDFVVALRGCYGSGWTFLPSNVFYHTLPDIVWCTTSVSNLRGCFLPLTIFHVALISQAFATTCIYQFVPGSWQFYLKDCISTVCLNNIVISQKSISR